MGSVSGLGATRQGGWKHRRRVLVLKQGAVADSTEPHGMSVEAQRAVAKGHPSQTAAALGALGVVYGDIGTSPLYALREAVKAASGGELPSPDAAFGVASLILWALILVVSFKYAI